MTYDEVIGMIPTRYWKVNDNYPNWDLEAGDLLVFQGSAETGYIIRVKPVPDPRRFETMSDWGLDCVFSSPSEPNTEGTVKGRHRKGDVDQHFVITITAGNPRASHRGDPAPVSLGEKVLDTGSWMADEGP